MSQDNRNMQDPAVQERIRRGHHEYVKGEGRHGTYASKPYSPQEFPKMMDKTPPPDRKAFKLEEDFQAARKEWSDKLERSIVHDSAQEKAWLRDNKEAA